MVYYDTPEVDQTTAFPWMPIMHSDARHSSSSSTLNWTERRNSVGFWVLSEILRKCQARTRGKGTRCEIGPPSTREISTPTSRLILLNWRLCTLHLSPSFSTLGTVGPESTGQTSTQLESLLGSSSSTITASAGNVICSSLFPLFTFSFEFVCMFKEQFCMKRS